MKKKCPCHSKKNYEECCKPYHNGRRPENAHLLMRSRYAAYALQLADYIIKTTHPSNPNYRHDHKAWASEILQFCRNTQFEDLEILDFQDGTTKATVTFKAHLKQGNKDATFTEKSYFEKVSDQWLYLSGDIL